MICSLNKKDTITYKENAMIEIGSNLRYEKYEFQAFDGSIIKIRNSSGQTHQIDAGQVKSIEIIGIKSNSGYCGTMEWGMSNPTFILPTNFFYNIINLFKRRNDTIHIKITLKDGKEFVILGNKDLYNQLLPITST